ncbi:uncharacterized protein [Rutidosis leptorrhynchoides]|uniref:uncharacterized protein n=1 Tax=Rutidosis leptorrhynchoides TaxID=125765 RepID=UPI003A99032C
MAIKGKWKGRGSESILVNVYGPHSDSNKQKLWPSLLNLVGAYDTEWVLCGDFNEVRDISERKNCEFIDRRSIWFNDFINASKLIEGDLSVLALDRKISDHCPIILRDIAVDFGPKPSKVFDEWLLLEGTDRLALKDLSQKSLGNIDKEIEDLSKKAAEWENLAENRQLDDCERIEWLDIRRKWLEKDKIRSNMVKQKSRVKWFVDGDENTKFFHSSLRRRYSKRNIRGLTINGVWNEDPIDIKQAVFTHFESRFKKQNGSRLVMAAGCDPLLNRCLTHD